MANKQTTDTYSPNAQTKTYAVSGNIANAQALTEVTDKHGESRIEVYVITDGWLESFCGYADRLQPVNPKLIAKLRSYFNNGERQLELV